MRAKTDSIHNSRFSRLQLIIFIVVFGVIGYIIFRSFAATNSFSWDTNADFNSGTLNNVAVANGSVTLSPTTTGSSPFKPDGVHIFMTDAEAAQMKKNIDDPSKPEIKKAYLNTKAIADGCGVVSAPPNSTPGLDIYRNYLLPVGHCAMSSAIVYKYTGNAAYAQKAAQIVEGFTNLDPLSVNWGGPTRDAPMAMFVYAYDLTREVYTSTQLSKIKSAGQRWLTYGKNGMSGVVNSPWVDYAPWGDAGSWASMEAYLGARIAEDQAGIDYVVKSNDINVDLATIAAKAYPKETPGYHPYHLQCAAYGYGSPNKPEIDPDVNGKPYTFKTQLIGMIARDGEMTGDCRASIWYESIELMGLAVIAQGEQHRHDTSVWPNGDPYLYTNVQGGQPKLKLAYEFMGRFLGHQTAFPYPAGYNLDQYTYVGSTQGQCGTIDRIGGANFVCQEKAHFNDLYSRFEDGYNHYPSSTALRDTVNATTMQGFAPITNLNGQALVTRGDRFSNHIFGYAAVTGDLGAVSSSESTASTAQITYPSSGAITLTHDFGQTVDWTTAGTSGVTKPSGTNVTFSYQSSADNVTYSAASSDISAIPNGRYLKVVATLTTSSNSSTPSLDRLTVNYDLVSTPPPPPSSSPNLITNPGFDIDLSGWNFFSDASGNSAASSGGQAVLNIANAAGSNIQLYQAGLTLISGHQYHLSFSARSSSGSDLGIEMIKHTTPFTNYGLSQKADLGTTMANYDYDFTASGFSGTVNDARLKLVLSGNTSNGDVYYLDNFSIVEATSVPPSPTSPPVFNSSNISTATSPLTGTFNWTVNASGDVASVEFWANGNKLSTDTVSPYSYNLDTTALPNGSNTFGVVVVGSDGTRVSAGTGGILATLTIDNPVAKKGDLDNDGKIDIRDLSLMLSSYGKSGSGDINNDGVINIVDLSILLSNWGK